METPRQEWLEWVRWWHGLAFVPVLWRYWRETLDLLERFKFWKKETCKMMDLMTLLKDINQLPVIVPKIQQIMKDAQAVEALVVNAATDPAISTLIADVIDLKKTIEGALGA